MHNMPKNGEDGVIFYIRMFFSGIIRLSGTEKRINVFSELCM